MFKLSVSDILGLLGLALGTVFIVLDKAGKLRGSLLLFLLAIAAGLTLPAALNWAWISDAHGLAKFSRVLLIVFAVGLVYSLIAVWVSPNTPEKNLKGDVEQPAQTKTEDHPPLLVRYEQGALPIVVNPKSTALVLQLHPQIRQWAYPIQNTNTEPLWWPDKGVEGDLTYVCVLTNPGPSLIDVEVTFHVGFFEPVAIQATQNPNGSISAPVIGRGHATLVRRIRGKVEAFTDGAQIASFDRTLTVPMIDKGESVQIFLVNQSRLVMGLEFPNTAVGSQVSEPSKRLSLTIVRPNVTVMDIIPKFWIAPAVYKWTGVPNP